MRRLGQDVREVSEKHGGKYGRPDSPDLCSDVSGFAARKMRGYVYADLLLYDRPHAHRHTNMHTYTYTQIHTLNQAPTHTCKHIYTNSIPYAPKHKHKYKQKAIYTRANINTNTTSAQIQTLAHIFANEPAFF